MDEKYLQEIFWKEINDDNIIWQKNGSGETAIFGDFAENNYAVYFNNLPSISGMIVPELRGKKIAEVSFGHFRNDPEKGAVMTDRTFNSDGREKRGFSTVYGQVCYAVAQKFDDYDVFYFDAFKRHSGDDPKMHEIKQSIYRAMIKKIEAKKDVKFHYYETNSRSDVGTLFICSKIKLSDQSERQFGIIHPLKEMMMLSGINFEKFDL